MNPSRPSIVVRVLGRILLPAIGGLPWAGCAAHSTAVGRIEGVVRFYGQVPKNPIADNRAERRPIFTVDPVHHGLAEAVAYLVAAAPPIGDLPPGADSPAAPVIVDQVDEAFVPHVVAVRAGQIVQFTNTDFANHNVRTICHEPRNQLNIMTPTRGAYAHPFVAEPRRPCVEVVCDLHPWMRAWIYVFEHPLFAVTDDAGRFVIGDAPPGRYTLVVEQPDGGLIARRQLDVRSGRRIDLTLEFDQKDLELR